MPESGWGVVKVPWLCESERDAVRRGAIALYSHRDLEESLASAYRAFHVPEGNRWLWRVLAEGHCQGMLAHTAGPNLHWIEFARIRDDLRSVIHDVGAWLPGRPLSEQEIDALAADLSLDRQKARPKVEPYDPHTLLFAQHFD